MGLFVALLRVGSIIAWITSGVAVLQAFNGAAWWVPLAWGAIAVGLKAALTRARRAAVARENERVAESLRTAVQASPRLAEALEYVQSPAYQQDRRPPGTHPYPIDGAGSVMMVLSWLSAIGGVAVTVAGFFLTPIGIWWVLLLGAGMLVATGPLHNAQKNRYASRVLPVYEADVLDPGAATPPPNLRLALWSAAQSFARPGANRDEQVAHMIEMYRFLVTQWSQDQVTAGSRVH